MVPISEAVSILHYNREDSTPFSIKVVTKKVYWTGNELVV
jgi:hypothetical protein